MIAIFIAAEVKSQSKTSLENVKAILNNKQCDCDCPVDDCKKEKICKDVKCFNYNDYNKKHDCCNRENNSNSQKCNEESSKDCKDFCKAENCNNENCNGYTEKKVNCWGFSKNKIIKEKDCDPIKCCKNYDCIDETCCYKKPETCCYKKPDTCCYKKPETCCYKKSEICYHKKPEICYYKKPYPYYYRKPNTNYYNNPKKCYYKRPKKYYYKKPYYYDNYC